MFNIPPLGKFWDLFKAGKAVKDAVALKDKQKIANGISGVLGTALALALVYFKIPPEWVPGPEVITAIGTVIAFFIGGSGLLNVGATVASSDKVGLLSNEPANAPIEDHSFVDGVPAPDSPEPSSAVLAEPIAVDQASSPQQSRSSGIPDSENIFSGFDTTYSG
ncbi:hypothetical protein [Undibacterium sp. TJN19]|uniref:hypothetical protein n=1 Tax=Undibacterium sp. TJN19 TaxID=3413055 RepID=UPI003BF3F278